MLSDNILKNLNTIPEIKISDDQLSAPVDYVDASAGDKYVLLHGNFTADQLEAVSAWMRSKQKKDS